MSQQINLFNSAFRKQRKYFSAVNMAQALGLILAGSAVLAAYTNQQLAGLSTQRAATSAQLGVAKAQQAKVNAQFAPQQKTKSLENEVQKTEAEVKAQQQVFDLLQKGEFGNTTGYAEYLRAFSRQIVGGLWLTGFSLYGAGNEIGLQGRALQPELVPAYISRLRREPVMLGKAFSILEMRVPQVHQMVKGDAAAAKQLVPAAYIEFSLQSAAAAKDAANPAAAGGK